jgi:hypothetical protein
MSHRSFPPALAITLLLATTAGTGFAQRADAPTSSSAAYREATDERLVVQPFSLTVDQIDDMDVYGANSEKVGEIDEVLVNASGQPDAVSVEVGGFLGIGGREAVVALDQLRLDGQRFVTSLTREQIEALPRWND